jgi:hypothetical protein
MIWLLCDKAPDCPNFVTTAFTICLDCWRKRYGEEEVWRPRWGHWKKADDVMCRCCDFDIESGQIWEPHDPDGRKFILYEEHSGMWTIKGAGGDKNRYYGDMAKPKECMKDYIRDQRWILYQEEDTPFILTGAL